MSVKIKVSFDQQAEIDAVLALLEPITDQVKIKPKNTESTHHRAYIEVKRLLCSGKSDIIEE